MKEFKRTFFVSAFFLIMISFIGLSVQAAEGDLIKESIQFDGMERTYEYYLPSNYDGSKPTELLFSFHGLGSDAEGQRSLTNFVNIAEKEGFIAVFPNATTLEAGEDSSITLPSLPGAETQWNDGRVDSYQNEQGIDDVGFVSELIDIFINNYNIDENRIYATGMSNGAMFSQRLAIELSDRLAAVASVTGGLPSEEFGLKIPKRPIPVIMIMGENDPIIPYHTAVPGTVMYWKHHNGTDDIAVRETLPKVDENDPTVIHKEIYGNGKIGSELILYRVEGGGHTWPGGPQYAPAEIIGLSSTQMNASEVIWEHFKNYSLKVEEPSTGLKKVELEVDGLKRTFDYYVPSSYQENKSVPLLLSFHGAGSSGAGQMYLSRFDEVAEREGFIAVFPDSSIMKDGEVLSPEDDSSFDPDSSIDKSWKIIHDRVDDVAFTDAILNYLEDNYNIDTNRVYATGMSSGALFSSHLAVMLPDRIAGIGLVTGQMTTDTASITAERPKTVVMVMGEDDPIYKARPAIFLSNEETIKYWLNTNRITTEPQVSYLPQIAENDPTKIRRTVYRGGKDNTEVIYYLVEGGGHTWPGGPQYLPPERIGLTSQHMNASEVIWGHLKERSLDEVTDPIVDDDDDDGDTGQVDDKDNGKGDEKDKSEDDEKGEDEDEGKRVNEGKVKFESKESDGKNLPKTATNMYTFVFIGALLTIMAVAIVIFRRKRAIE
ncbi:LPXTG cell wall anchor domain-containing protein [Pueribacillus sp. YX66]|uniref:LPXTG cell wall anchor domain-containing protein n=1 Tax=Pueribacillus sp. YX66 TaxID=3229242 RepID=UPI00358D10A3